MRNLRRYAIFAVKAVVSGLLILYLLDRVGSDRLRGTLQAPSWTALAAATTLLAVYFTMSGLRWLVILRGLNHRAAPGDILRISFVAQFFSQFLPSSVGTDALRMWQSVGLGLPLSASVSSVLLERLTNLAGVGVLTGFLFPLRFGAYFPGIYTYAGLSIGVLSLLLVLLPVFVNRLVAPAVPRWLGTLALATDARRLLADSQCIALLIGGMLSGVSTFAATLFVLGPDYGVAAGPLDCLAIGAVTLLVGAVPISIAGWGVRELALVEIYSRLGMNGANALRLSVAVGLLSVVASLPGAIVWLTVRRRKGGTQRAA